MKGIEQRLYRELLFAIERTRSRLAVAIASENKVTPRELWHHYLETEDCMRTCVREIRRHRSSCSAGHSGWIRALSLLRQPLPPQDHPSRGEAQQLCQRLRDVLEIINSCTIDD